MMKTKDGSKKSGSTKAIGRKLCWLAALVGMWIATAAQAGQLLDRDFNPQSYPYSDHRDFYVYVPDVYDGHAALPMVMVLHGCHQTRDTVFNEFGWDEAADQYGFIVVAPDISTDDLLRNPHCWGYWESKEIHQGQGEVEDLHNIGRQVEQEWRIDPDRRHIAGMSSGGFMVNAAAVAHNEYWASAGVHSGGGYNETAATYSLTCASPRQSSGIFKAPETISADMRTEMDSDYRIPVMLIHSANDCAVGHGVEGDPSEWGGLTSNRQAWLAVNGGNLFATTDCSRDGIACQHLSYGSDQRSTLEVVDIVGLIQGTDAGKGHYWSGGAADGQWTKTLGPKAVELFWDFFLRHPRQVCTTCPAAPTGLKISDVGEQHVSLSWNANPESNLVGYHPYRNGSKIEPNPITRTSCTDTGLQKATTYTYHVTAVNDANQESLPSKPVIAQTKGDSDCRSYDATLAEHTAQGRAHMEEKCFGWWCWFWPFPKTTAYYAAGSEEFLGNNESTRVVLYTRDGQSYSTADCTNG